MNDNKEMDIENIVREHIEKKCKHPEDNSNVPTKVVLSEEEYHEMYKQSYCWANVEQLQSLYRTNCFFIGMSMTDPNLRRLLEIAHNE